MNTPSSRQEILDRIAGVTDNRPDAGEVAYTQEEIFKPVEPDALTCFKNELEAIAGQCVICQDEKDMYAKLAALMQEKGLPVLFSRDTAIAEKLRRHHINVESDESCFDDMVAGVTGCEYLVARTGSVVVTTLGGSGRQMHAFPPVHVIVADTSQLVDYLQDALEAVQQKYSHDFPSAVSVITGPSRTADIEKTLVLGAHGPKELVIFVEQK